MCLQTSLFGGWGDCSELGGGGETEDGGIPVPPPRPQYDLQTNHYERNQQCHTWPPMVTGGECRQEQLLLSRPASVPALPTSGTGYYDPLNHGGCFAGNDLFAVFGVQQDTFC